MSQLYLFLTLNLFLRLCKCTNVSFDISIASLIEFDANEEAVLSNTYTQFTTQDWRNSTFFEPILSNQGYLQMNIADIPQNNEIRYDILLRDWPWQNEDNSIEFCFNISVSNGNDLEFKCSRQVWIRMQSDNIDICHTFRYNQLITTAHIHYSTVDNKTDNITYNKHTKNEILSKNGEHMVWLFGVSMTIGFIVCLFVSVICYLMKQGFFDDTPKRHSSKRKRSPVIAGMAMGKTTQSTNSGGGDRASQPSPSSPKKNLRINVTYHSPTPQNPNKIRIDTVNNNNINPEYSKTYTHTKTRTKTNTCDTVIIIDTLLEGNEEDERDGILDNVTPVIPASMGVTPTLNSINGSHEFDHESSLIQYIITCSSNNDNDDDDVQSSPVPFM